MKYGKLLGNAIDNCGRELEGFSDGSRIFLVYERGTKQEYNTSEFIQTIEDNKEEYLYTPYIEFIE